MHRKLAAIFLTGNCGSRLMEINSNGCFPSLAKNVVHTVLEPRKIELVGFQLDDDCKSLLIGNGCLTHHFHLFEKRWALGFTP